MRAHHWIMLLVVAVVAYYIGSKYPSLIPLPKIGG